MLRKPFISLSGSTLLAVASLLAGSAASAQDASEQVIRATRNTSITVPIYKSRVVVTPAPIKRVSIGNPDIADVLVLGSDDLYVLGKDLGTTNVLLWDRNDVLVSALAISITHDIDGLKRQISTVLPGEKIEVASVQRNLVLSGQVSSAVKMDAALQLAKGFLEQAATAKQTIMFEQKAGSNSTPDKKAGEVINLMTVGGSQQVMLQVKVAEVSHEAIRNLNAQMSVTDSSNNGKWVVGGVNGGGTFSNRGLSVTTPSITSTGLFASFLSNELLANVVLDAYQQKGLAKILAEPTVTTLSGQEAQFLSGGSFPIPVSQENGAIGIEFKDYGVRLIFQPLILDGGRINLKLNISVSELSDSSALTVAAGSTASYVIPGITERRALSTVELSDGQTIGIAGLLNENMRGSVNKFPGLGDIPILGQLFRSQNYQSGQTELVILVTPKLAKPIAPKDVKLPTDSLVDPSNAEFFFLGHIEGMGDSKSEKSEQAQKKSDTTK